MINNFIKETIEKAERNAGLVNLILDYAIEHSMSAKEVDNCVEIAKEVYYANAIIQKK